MEYFVSQAHEQVFSLLALFLSILIVLSCLHLRMRLLEWVKQHVVMRTLTADRRLQELLVEIRVKVVADRVSIYLFHNGEHYINGNSILRLSGAYESLAPGISNYKEYSQNILVSTIPEAVAFLCDLAVSREVCYQETQELPTCYYRAVLETQGVRAVAKYPLFCNGHIIGFVCADFVQSPGSRQEMEEIRKVAPQLELQLESRGCGWFRKLLSKLVGGV